MTEPDVRNEIGRLHELFLNSTLAAAKRGWQSWAFVYSDMCRHLVGYLLPEPEPTFNIEINDVNDEE